MKRFSKVLIVLAVFFSTIALIKFSAETVSDAKINPVESGASQFMKYFSTKTSETDLVSGEKKESVSGSIDSSVVLGLEKQLLTLLANKGQGVEYSEVGENRVFRTDKPNLYKLKEKINFFDSYSINLCVNEIYGFEAKLWNRKIIAELTDCQEPTKAKSATVWMDAEHFELRAEDLRGVVYIISTKLSGTVFVGRTEKIEESYEKFESEDDVIDPLDSETNPLKKQMLQ